MSERTTVSNAPYASITFNDPNRIKRWFQRRRLDVCLGLMRDTPSRAMICDYGAGNGELCKRAVERFPDARFVCVEPVSSMRDEARDNLSALANVQIVESANDISDGSIDVLCCLEVFEHLPPAETSEALRHISRVVRPGGTIVIGVPVEIGLPALYRGIFRMVRRWGDDDTVPLSVIRATLGFPPKCRGSMQLAPGLTYIYLHNGFDHRRLREELERHFAIRETAASPLPGFGASLNSEIYYRCKK